MTVCTPAFWRHGVAQALIALALYLPGSSPKDAALPSVTRFEAVMRYTLDWEGGYLWDPDDPGGETNHGISRRQYPHLDIANLTRVQTMAIYLRDYWRPYHEDIASYQIASRLFDLSVNMGHAHPNKMLQRAVNQQQFHLKVDGRLGPESIRAINACDADRLYRDFARQARSRYETLARLGNNRKFLAKWLERLDNPIPQAKRKRWARHFI